LAESATHRWDETQESRGLSQELALVGIETSALNSVRIAPSSGRIGF